MPNEERPTGELRISWTGTVVGGPTIQGIPREVWEKFFWDNYRLRLIGPAEAAVLDRAADINVRWLESYVHIIVPTQADPQAYAFVQAELARRQQQAEKGR